MSPLMDRNTRSIVARGRIARLRALSGLVLVLVLLSARSASADAPRLTWQHEHEGILVEATMEPIDLTDETADRPFQEGRTVDVRFRITDTTSHEPISGLFPAAWMDRLPTSREQDTDTCKSKVEAFLGGSLFAVPEVDMNVYYVLALNDNATINVVDPLFGFGGSKLLAQILLESRGEDWAMSQVDKRLFVSMPETNRVAVVDLATWTVTANIDVGGVPVELEMSPDGQRLWVSAEAAREGFGGSGITIIDTKTLEVVEHVATGSGPHKIAFSDDGRYGVVTNGGSGSVSVLDARSNRVVRRYQVGGQPIFVDWSSTAKAAFVSDTDGAILVIDPQADELRARITAEKGLGRLRFERGGRFGFVVNTPEDLVHIIDAAKNKIIQTADVESGPDQVVFSDELAYIRHRGSEIVLMIPLDTIGQEGEAVPVIDFPGGAKPFGEATLPSPADAIVQAPGSTAVLVANPADRRIYFYKEGMAAPMGSFQNYDSEPRAVQVVDRSLREIEPGVYRTAVKLRRPGEYDLVFYLDAPTMATCFEFEVALNPEIEQELVRGTIVMARVDTDLSPVAGQEARMRFRASDPVGGEAVTDLEDLGTLIFLSPGVWQTRPSANHIGDGIYEVAFTPPETGLYFIYFESASLGMKLNRSPSFFFEVRSTESVSGAGDREPGDGETIARQPTDPLAGTSNSGPPSTHTLRVHHVAIPAV